MLSELPVHCTITQSLCVGAYTEMYMFVCGCGRRIEREVGGVGCMYGQPLMNLSTGMRRSQLSTFCLV